MPAGCPPPNGLAPNVTGVGLAPNVNALGVGLEPKVKAFEDELAVLLVDPNGLALLEPKPEDREDDDVVPALPNENVDDEAKEKVVSLEATIEGAAGVEEAPKEKTDAGVVDEAFEDPKVNVVDGGEVEVVVDEPN